MRCYHRTDGARCHATGAQVDPMTRLCDEHKLPQKLTRTYLVRRSTKYEHTFVARGTGAFPLDMLRYDVCYPATNQPTGSTDRALSQDPDAPGRNVRLRHTSESRSWEPTAGRWESFGWRILP